MEIWWIRTFRFSVDELSQFWNGQSGPISHSHYHDWYSTWIQFESERSENEVEVKRNFYFSTWNQLEKSRNLTPSENPSGKSVNLQFCAEPRGVFSFETRYFGAISFTKSSIEISVTFQPDEPINYYKRIYVLINNSEPTVRHLKIKLKVDFQDEEWFSRWK